MKKIVISISFCVLCCIALALSSHNSKSRAALPGSMTLSKPAPADERRIQQAYGKLPLSFEINQGQTDKQVKFFSRGSGYSLFLTSNEAVLSLRKGEGGRVKDGRNPAKAASLRPHPTSLSVLAVVRMKLVGANPAPQVSGLDKLPSKSNYFLGNDHSKWRTNVSHYGKVKQANVYPGIDLIYYGNQSQLEYDFVVAPGADPNRIRMKFAGARHFTVNRQGQLVLDTDSGKVVQHAPIIYQNIHNHQKRISGSYHLQGKSEVSFRLAAYDTHQSLIIDPMLVYSTYLGGSGTDYGTDIAVDNTGNAYVTGRTLSTDFPIQSAVQPANSGSSDVFVSKIDAGGSVLMYSTYLGGSGNDDSRSIAVDNLGNVYITGSTSSTDFPIQSAVQPIYGGGDEDAFISKLNATGSSLVYSTYLGGSSDDQGIGIAIDSVANAFITGRTTSTNFPTVSPLQPTNRGSSDIFVGKLNAMGSALAYSTYLGGSGVEQSGSIAVDSMGDAYVTGQTSSTNFPTANALQPANGGGYYGDVFISKLNATGSSLVYSTYLGGNGDDNGVGIAIDGDGNTYITGDTSSTNFPIVNAVQPTLHGNSSYYMVDAFITKINVTGSALIYSTYLGGSTDWGADYGKAIAVDKNGNAYVTGYTRSADFPTVNAIQSTYLGGTNGDAFITKLNATGLTLLYSTYLGGNSDDSGYGIALDGVGNAYIAGATYSLNFPTLNPIPATRGDSNRDDAFVTKISDQNPLPTPVPTPVFAPTATPIPTPTPDSTPTSIQTPTPAPTATPGATPVPAPTPIPTATPIAMPIPTPIPVITLSDSVLTLTDNPADPRRTVDGIVCDNLRGMSDTVKSSLTVTSNYFSRATITASLSGAPDRNLMTDQDGKNNIGQIIVSNGQITYYPPEEQNYRQEPQGVNDVIRSAKRLVYLKVNVTKPDGTRYIIQPKPIILARPPVVLVHGINSSSADWTPLVSAVQRSLSIRMPFVAVNHHGYNNGNGAVEIGASLLANRISRTLGQVRNGVPITDDEYLNFSDYVGHRLAIKRVDVLGWSYGGVIARWYLASRGSRASWGWYKRPDYRNKPLPLTTYGNDVRKVITLGSMWRGVPLCNYLNEVLFPVTKSTDPDLALAPLPKNIGYRRIGDIVEALPIPIRVPSMEVMAIESPWMRQLIFGNPNPSASALATPFSDDVAYGSVAGDSNRYLLHIPLLGDRFDSYTTIDAAQQPSWFPYFGLEVRPGTDRNYTDGIVPVWSSAIPGSYKISPTNHKGYPGDRDTRDYIIQWLNHAGLPQGRSLNSKWRDSEQSKIMSMEDGTHKRKTWMFSPNLMAPHPQNNIYGQLNGVGRINPSAIKEIGNTKVSNVSRTGFTVSWSTVVETDTEAVTVLQQVGTMYYSIWSRDRGTVRKKTHSWQISGLNLRSNGRYYCIVSSKRSAISSSRNEDPDKSISLSSDKVLVYGGVLASVAKLSTGIARAATATLQLEFTSALDEETASDPAHYRIEINGQAIAVIIAGYNSRNGSVTLAVSEGAMQVGDHVMVQWNGIQDAKGTILSGQTGPVIVR